MGKGTSSLPGEGENGPGGFQTESISQSEVGRDGHDELRSLLIKNVLWMLGGLVVIVAGLVVVAIIANSGRINSSTGNELLDTTSRTSKRNACITELRSQSDSLRGEVLVGVLSRLAILDGYDPGSGKKIPLIEKDGSTIPDPKVQASLSQKYVSRAMVAADAYQEASQKLLQPKLNELCGKPVMPFKADD